MRWPGETSRQWGERVRQWHHHFCLFPAQMNDGTWVWLEHVWRRAYTAGFGTYFEFTSARTPPEDIKSTPPKR